MILEDKAIKFIQTIGRNMTNLNAGNSGGKDSAVVDFLLQKAELTIKAITLIRLLTHQKQLAILETITHILKYYNQKKHFTNWLNVKGCQHD